MPIFSYICRDCNEKFDLFVGAGDKNEKHVCKKCGSKRIEKVFSTFGVSFSSGKSKGNYNDSCPMGTCPLG